MTVKDDIRQLAADFARQLGQAIESRVVEMENDDISHYLLYRVLGVPEAEGKLIDVYQNKGRFLYKYAGSFLEAATKLCFTERFPSAMSLRIPNTFGTSPKTFEIDCLVGNNAHEIKWRDATTDGDHIIKEHARIQVVAQAGYTPIRIMFYYPNREQAIRIQQAIEALYRGIGGQYYFGDAAWNYVLAQTEIDLKGILQEIANENAQGI